MFTVLLLKDRHLDCFLSICSALEENRLVLPLCEANVEANLKKR